jgi:hypothetical protein
VAVRGAVGDDVYVPNHHISQPIPPPPTELLDLLRRIADHDDVPGTVQADAREYLRHLEAASSGSGTLAGEARLNMATSAALQQGRELVQRVPRPRCGTI